MNWNELNRRLRESLDIPAGEVEVNPVHGGDINRAFCLTSAGERFFVKTNRAERLPMFEAEQAGLEAIDATGAITVPRPLLTGCLDDEAYIVMTYLELGGRSDPDRLAIALAAMHSSFGQRFGFTVDNTIGSTPQPNRWCDDWVGFWREQRLGYQLQLAATRGFDSALVDAGAKLNQSLSDFFSSYRPRPSLLHGDLWGGNQGADRAGNPVIYDPACYYGDHEADLAMMELFGSPGQRFFDVYRERFALDPGYPQRRDLYNLYHILNHAILFGGGYANQALQMVRRLLAQL